MGISLVAWVPEDTSDIPSMDWIEKSVCANWAQNSEWDERVVDKVDLLNFRWNVHADND